MNKLLKVVGGLVLLYIVVIGGSGLAIRALLSSSLGENVRERLQEKLPVEASIAGGDFDLAEWFLLRPAISFEDLRIGNPQGFSAEPLLEADRVAARADLSALFDDEVRIHTVEIEGPTARIESDAQGGTNIQALLEALDGGGSTSEDAQPSDEATTLVVESFRITGGSIIYTAPDTDDLEVRNLDLAIENFAPDQAFDLSAELDVFAEEAIHLSFDGATGPFAPQSSPASGTFRMEGLLGRLPAKFRQENLGAFLAEPGAGSRLGLEAALEGDLLGVLTGTGELQIEDVMLGDPQQGQLPLNGRAPVLLTLIDPIADPSFQLVMPDASLQLGAGSWQGGVEVQYDGSGVRGKSTGAVSGVDVNQILSAFTPAQDTLFGAMAIERYDLSFAGRDADQIVESLNGSGRIDLTDGKLAAFDVLGTIEQHVKKVLGGDQPASGVTSFVRFGTNFEVRDQKIHAPNLLLENEAARIGGAGSLGFDQSLDFDLSSLVSGALARTLGGRPNADGVAQVAVPLDVGGMLTSPKVRPDLKRLAQKAAVDQAQGLLESLFDKKSGEEGAGEEGAEPAEESKPRLPFDLGGLLRKKKE